MKNNIFGHIDFEKINQLLEGFSKSTGFVTAILDLDGTILFQSEWRQICAEFHRIHPDTAKKCTESDTVLAGEMGEGEKYHFYKCRNGLIDVAVPIIIHNEHIANLFSGQFFFKKPDRQFFINQAKKNKFDIEKYLNALDKVPVVSKEKVKIVMDFLLNMTKMISDMTMQKMEQAELNEALRNSEEKYRALYNNSPLSYQSLNENGFFKDINPAWLRTLGYERNEVIGKRYIDFLHPDWKKHFEKNFQAFKKRGYIHNVQFKIRHKDGHYIDISFEGCIGYNSNGTFKQTFCVFQDITERLKVKQECQKARQDWKSIFQAIGHPTFILSQDHTILATNKATQKATGLSAEELKGKKCFEIFHSSDIPPKNCPSEILLNSGKVKTLEMEVESLNGTFLISCTPVFDSDNKIEKIIHIATDITDRIKAEKDLKIYREHLEEMVKDRTKQLESSNKELEAFAYSISHDLRAPLRAIDGFTQILMQDYVDKLDSEGRRIGKIIQDNSKKLGTLIDDLLAFSRLGRISLNVSKIDMKNMIRAIYHEIMVLEDQERIDFSIGELATVEGDTSMFRQLWINLISNAIKFSSKRSKAVISVTSENKKDRTIFCIKDNGAGFNMKYKEKLFGVFQRLHTDKEFQGTGVGLAIVQRIINRHNGEVWAEGYVDKGAAFYISLPKK